MYKPFDTGALTGRFQTIHKGHQNLIDTGRQLCDRLIILVGSAQESGTERNPFNIATRINMIKEIYGGYNDVFIYALPDLTNENDITPDWGRYVLDNIKRYIHKPPELMIYGDEPDRRRWFASEDRTKTCEFVVPRDDTSATMLRDFMIDDNREAWMKYTDQKIHKLYDPLRAEMMEVPFYRERSRRNG